MNLDQLPDVLTVEEFAAFARIGRRQAYSAVRRGDVYARKIGKSLRIPKSAIARWLDPENENGQVHHLHLAEQEEAHGPRRRPRAV